jgi:hypothetical protein
MLGTKDEPKNQSSHLMDATESFFLLHTHTCSLPKIRQNKEKESRNGGTNQKRKQTMDFII